MVSEQEAKRVETLVNEALVEKQGNAAAFSRFRTSNSKRWCGNAYVFACDQNLIWSQLCQEVRNSCFSRSIR